MTANTQSKKHYPITLIILVCTHFSHGKKLVVTPITAQRKTNEGKLDKEVKEPHKESQEKFQERWVFHLLEDKICRGERGMLDMWVRWTTLNIFVMPKAILP